MTSVASVPRVRKWCASGSAIGKAKPTKERNRYESTLIAPAITPDRVSATSTSSSVEPVPRTYTALPQGAPERTAVRKYQA